MSEQANECDVCEKVFGGGQLKEARDGKRYCEKCWEKADYPPLKNQVPGGGPTIPEYPDES